MKRFTVLVCVILAVALVVYGAVASVPRLINYQGILTDDTGTPITGSHDLTFAIYEDSSQGATALWSEPHTGVEVDVGLFNVILGKTVTIPDSLLADGDRWMGITVDAGSEMTPRMQLTSVPWAFRSAVADSAGTVLWSSISGMPAGFADGVDDVGGAGDGHSLDAADGDPADVVYVDNEGYVGIGTTSPITPLHVTGDRTVLFGADTLGAGNKLMWLPSKSAFRAGSVTGSQWDWANIGDYSVAMGYGTTASGDYSTVMGVFTTASGALATAMGWNTTASGNYSTAMGQGTTASNLYSTAMGDCTTASGVYSTAMGTGTTASGHSSTAMGVEITAESYASTAIGRYNVGGGDPLSWVATDPLFEIGNGVFGTPANAMTVLKNGNLDVAGTVQMSGFEMPTGASNGHVLTSDAAGVGSWQSLSELGDGDWQIAGNDMYSNVSGNVGIGTTAPTEKLDLGNGDIRIRGVNGWTSGGDQACLYFGNEHNYIRDERGAGLRIGTWLAADAVGIQESTGFVGIGTTSPSEKLDVAGTAEMDGFKMPTGASSGYVLTSDPTGVGSWQSPSVVSDGDWIISGNDMYSNVSGNVGIGITSPIAPVHIASNKTVLFGADTLGAGSKLMWLPAKSAFRAGSVSSTQWDWANIGDYSAAMGQYTTASGSHSTAMGNGATASGTNSTAIGSGTASGIGSTAIGSGTASGMSSVAMGSLTAASGNWSLATGVQTAASGEASAVAGHGTKAESYNSTAIGRYNVGGGNPTTWIDADPLFEVGNGTSDVSRSNAMTVRKNGDVEVGGDLVVDGAYRGDIGPNNGAPFPRPAYDSGWVSINPDQLITLTHNIGGDAEDYVVDMTFKDGAGNIHISGFGGIITRVNLPTLYPAGAAWGVLTPTSINIRRFQEDEQAEMIRIRIWAYN